ncbi:MAG: integral rane sensor hybrid histidine kinase [Xanthobacteraceae bacterium]|nr:integral rane sensor hybrid histidine kinase [Xanthobacteraceae bacterium]
MADGSSKTSRPGLSIRGYLILFVLAVVLPTAVFAGVLFARYYQSAVESIEVELQNDARQLALTIDRDLAGLTGTLQTLTVSSFLPVRNYEAFHEQATRVKSYIGVDLLLRDPAGQQLVNTRVPYGTALPLQPQPDDPRVLATKRPVVGNLMLGALTGIPLFAITTPVLVNGEVTHFINAGLESGRYIPLLKEATAAGRVAAIVDRNGVVIAHSSAPFSGRKVPDDFRALLNSNEGLWRGVSIGGPRVLRAFAKSKAADWWIYVSMADADIRDALNRTLLTMAGLGLGLSALALALAYVLGGRIAGAIQKLADQAERLGRGEVLVPGGVTIAEVDRVDTALVAAADELRKRERERDAALRQLKELSHSLENTVEERTRELTAEMKRRATTEDALRQSQKMEAIGQLTGGIAHDFNNMLAVVMGSLDLAKRHLARGTGKIERYIDNALDGAQRAAALTQRLLAFARQQPLSPEPIDANKLVAGMSELLRGSLGETIRLETVLAAGLWRAHADPNQLESAILNLAVNARDAMPEGGKLTIETANAHFDDAYAVRENMAAGQYVMIAVTDTGEGMPTDVMARAFDPFFTTKKSGSGTGLGLSQVYGFVKQSSGHVKIYTEPNQGTSVKIYLPRFTGNDASPREAGEPVPTPNDGSITVLIVEDDPSVRRQSIEALQELGYSTIEADGGASALRLLDDDRHIDLLFTDVVMPDMNGRKLADAALARRPDLKVLFTTGYTKNAIVHNAVLDQGVHLISKPFTLDQLARKLSDVLRG